MELRTASQSSAFMADHTRPGVLVVALGVGGCGGAETVLRERRRSERRRTGHEGVDDAATLREMTNDTGRRSETIFQQRGSMAKLKFYCAT